MKHVRTFALLSLLALTPADAVEAVNWSIDAGAPGIAVSPTMHGIFFEDINYAADGGLYAELIENRSFEHGVAMYAWREEARDKSGGKMIVSGEGPIHPNNPHFLRLELPTDGAPYGISNLGYGGIALSQGEEYKFSIHARTPSGYAGSLRVKLVDTDGGILAEGLIPKITDGWARYQIPLVSKAAARSARLVVLAEGPGQVDLDMVSLFPKATWKGRDNGMRVDLAQALADLKPGFMRFPGGCVVEGFDLANAYRWKDTVGDVSTRKQNWNRWTTNDPNKPDGQYHQSYGLGFFEFFQLCEDIGASPVPVLNCGMSCQFQAKQLISPDQLDPWVQDALDLVEFANGPTTSRWGKLRAEMGHPQSFNMKVMGIGNEQWGQAYFDRYAIFYKALKKRYPEISLITTSGPGVDDEHWRFAWNQFRSGTPADIVDEHYYRPPAWFLDNAHRYDDYDRKGPKVFAGEFAAHRTDRKSTLDAAVSEAAFMTGLLANADVVSMSCYAPLLARDGFTQWTPDLIWFDQTRVMKTPSYHIQAMYGNNRPDVVVPSNLEGDTTDGIATGRIGLGTWDSQAEFKDIVVKQGNSSYTFTKPNLGDWERRGGKWSETGGVISQKGSDKPATIMAGDPSWSDYTVSLKARKTGGNEGFLIMFRVDEDQKSWWNVGGWTNTAHAFELPGYQSKQVPGTVEINRWYDIKVEVKGAEIRAFLDGRLVQQVKRPVRQKVYAVAGMNRAKNEMILHMTNPQPKSIELSVSIDHWTAAKAAQGFVLTSMGANDMNTLSAPDSVTPKPVRYPWNSGSVKITLPPTSHTTLRVR
jgi:alpha-L-arabinofuranosidase